MFKRIFDLLLGSLALVVALPLMALAALMVYLEDGLPVIFRQTRVGKDGRLFEMFKIRTMIKDAEPLPSPGIAKADYKTRNDPRVTRIGRLLRRFSLDELPQLFNVLDGTMSLVGPRPELPHFVEKYEAWQRKRLEVLPGITGWWQVNSRNDEPMYLHVEDDLYYIQNYSLWLDLQIIVRTLWVVVSGKGSF